MLGSIIPSSRFLIRQLLAPVNWTQARVFVEYGPGVGGITAEILRRMHPDAILIAIEMNPDFVSYLGRAIPDPRLKVVQGSAESVDEILRRFGHTPSVLSILRAYYVGHLGKYVPGKAWALFMRASLIHGAGVPPGLSTRSATALIALS